MILIDAGTTYIQKGAGYCLITEVRIASIRLDVAVTFNTVNNHHYVLEKSDDMVTWSSVGGAEDVTGTGDSKTVYDLGGGPQSQRVYRVRLLE